MKIAIIEDESIHSELLAAHLQAWSAEKGIPVNIIPFSSAEGFLFVWEESSDFDILFVDIQMKGMDGLEMARRIREKNGDVAIVFTTGIGEYMQEGYEVEAMHYLLKPVSQEKIGRCMDKLAQRQYDDPFILVHRREETLKLSVRQITYLEARGHGCVVETCTRMGETERVEIMESISEMEKMLAPYDFIKCHRSYLGRVGGIRRIGKTELVFDNGSVIPVSRRMYKEINQAFVRHFLDARQEEV